MNAAPEEPLVFMYRLKPGMGAEYDRAHRAVWPEILALLDAAGIYDYRIWRRGDLVVSAMRTVKGFDYASRVTATSEVQSRWTASLAHVFEQISDEDGTPLWLDLVFAHRPQEEPGP
ncbi:L-rhamnose mutarotase [Hoeflea sp. G2-23]|uniref:L-rhamnose mutarotase n=1 Tax=Hoeflea algicola TaxID=2983763 RepID=A0ABT3ZA16_9HYPH|nr:L-rhamnose mutarotase [Hoeflea algicola]MCY0148632.1 L-rhamnose mutarotase [Hoeflea algicola]